MNGWCPFAEKAPISRNFEVSRGRDAAGAAILTPSMICDHIADGYGDLFIWFNRVPVAPDTGSSAHFLVMKSGRIRQYIDALLRAWSNGPKNKPDLNNPLIASIVAHGLNPNQFTVSKEHEGHPDEVWPEAQVQASAKLDAWLAQTFGIPLDATHLVGHFQFDSVDRGHCPGPNWPKPRLLTLAQALTRPGLDQAAKDHLEAMYFGPLWRLKDAMRTEYGANPAVAPSMLDLAHILEDKIIETKHELGLQ